MTTISNPQPGAATVNYDNPPVKAPPVLTIGPLAWVRNNLFRSTFDTLLTIGFGLLAIYTITGLINWTVSSANWFAITKNMRFFMAGRYPLAENIRLEWFVLYLSFLVGFSVACWGRVSRVMTGVVVIMLALCFIVPPVAQAVLADPVGYLTAGNQPIQAGTITEEPENNVAFIAQPGDQLKIELADAGTDDESMADLSGFFDRGARAIFNSSRNRLTTDAEIARLDALLADETLTERQRAAATEEREGLEPLPSVTEGLALNQQPVYVAVLDGETLEPVIEALLTAETPRLVVTLEEGGWYVLRKTTEGETGAALLQTENFIPLMVNEFSARDIRYRSMVDNYEVNDRRPVIDGRDVPLAVITDYQYLGERTFGEYIRLHLAPLLDLTKYAFLWMTVAFALGYAVSRLLDRMTTPVNRQQRLSLRLVRNLWLSAPIVILFLIVLDPLALGRGLVNSLAGLVGAQQPFGAQSVVVVDPSLWGGLLLTFMLTAVGIVMSFPIGVLLALGRRSGLPVVKWVCILFIELVRGVPLITILFIANLMLPLLDERLVTVEGVIRAMVGITLFSAAYLAENVRGGLQSIPPGQEEAAKALGLSGWQVIRTITLPQALRAVIPALVGQCIALFKDTSLVAIIGQFDLTKIADNVISQPEFIGSRSETYLFISLLYFAFSYVMGYISRRIEASGSGAARRI